MHRRRMGRASLRITRTALGVLGVLLLLALPHRAHATTLIVEERASVGERPGDTGIEVRAGSSALYGTLAPGEGHDAYSFVAPASGSIAAALLVNTRPDSSDIRIRLSLASAEGTLTATGDVPVAYAERFDMSALDSQRGVAYGRFDILGGETYTIVVDSETFSPVTVPYVVTLEAPMTWPTAKNNALGPVARLWSGAYAQRPIRAIPVAVAVVVVGFLAIALWGVAMVAVQSLKRRRAGNLPAGPPQTRDDAPLLTPVLITPGRTAGAAEEPELGAEAEVAEEPESVAEVEAGVAEVEAGVAEEPEVEAVSVEAPRAPGESSPAKELEGPTSPEEPGPPAILETVSPEDLTPAQDEPQTNEAARKRAPATHEKHPLLGHLRSRHHRGPDAERVALDARINPYASANTAGEDEADA